MLTVLLGGINITEYVQEETIQIKDALGQGAGTGGFAVGRAATCSFLTRLGPAASALGAGSHVSTPTLLRQGEIRIFGASGICIFGGYIGKLTDQTIMTTVSTQCDCYNYWQHLDRLVVTELFTDATDITILKALCTTYAPWLKLDLIPLVGAYRFTVKNFRNISLQKALAELTNATGWLLWVDTDRYLHYSSPNLASRAPFGVSTDPDFYATFPFTLNTYEIDDNAAITRVTFFGGRRPSNDFTQDLSTQANGSNTLFVLAYYPRKASDDKFHVRVHEAEQVVGYELGAGEENEFKSKRGKADVLLNADSHTLLFDIAPTNTGPSSVTCTYRYQYPLVGQIEDQDASRFYGQHFDGVISDESIFDPQAAVARCRVLLAEQSRGLTHLKLTCYRAGLQAGQLLSVFHSVRGIMGTFLIQEVDVSPLGAGAFQYSVDLGAWRWDLVDIVLNAVRFATASPTTPEANGQDEAPPLHVPQVFDHLTLSSSVTTRLISSQGVFYARLTPVADGHDAYPGFSYLA